MSDFATPDDLLAAPAALLDRILDPQTTGGERSNLLTTILRADHEQAKEFVRALARQERLVVLGDRGEAGDTGGLPREEILGPVRRAYARPTSEKGALGPGLWLLYVPGKPAHPLHVVACFASAVVSQSTFVKKPVHRLQASGLKLAAWEANHPITVLLSNPNEANEDEAQFSVDEELEWFSLAAHEETPIVTDHEDYTLHVPRP